MNLYGPVCQHGFLQRLKQAAQRRPSTGMNLPSIRKWLELHTLDLPSGQLCHLHSTNASSATDSADDDTQRRCKWKQRRALITGTYQLEATHTAKEQVWHDRRIDNRPCVFVQPAHPTPRLHTCPAGGQVPDIHSQVGCVCVKKSTHAPGNPQGGAAARVDPLS